MSILVVGSLHLDVVLRAPHLPATDETVAGSGVEYVFGGKGGNQAVAAARMGADVSFAGRAGSDSFGDVLRRELREYGVRTDMLQLDPGPSGMSAAIVDAQGDYGAVIVSAANRAIDPHQIEIPRKTTLVLLQNEIPENVNIDTAARARDAGALVWLNAAPARPLPPALLRLTDLLIVNRVEAASYQELPSTLDVLVTLGPGGVNYRGRNHPARPVENVVSSHGAGDMFVGALAARVAAGDEMEVAIAVAQQAASWYVAASPEERRRERNLAAMLTDQASP